VVLSSAKMQTTMHRSSFKAGVKAPSSRNLRISIRAVAEVEAPVERKAGPLQRGGTLSGADAAGKDAGAAAKAAVLGQTAGGTYNQIVNGKFKDDRWSNGTWVLSKFAGKDGETNWDKVIDAEIARRSLLETTPIPVTANCKEDMVVFDTSEIPWWAWVKRFHLPEAEKLNGRAAMVGYLLAGLVDLVSGAGLVDQQESFLGKLALHIAVFGVLIVRSTADLDKYKGLIDEATFYDKQWSATWEGVRRPSESQE